MILASRPGQPGPRVDKRGTDVKLVQIDCSPLLEPNELIYGDITVINSEGLNISDTKTKAGKYLYFKCAGGAPGSGNLDYKVIFLIKTSFGSTISVPVTIRVFAQ